MLTPIDIQKQSFTKGVRGYKEEEVDKFLDLITLDMNALIKENDSLKEKVVSKDEELLRFRSSEKIIFDTLESAKKLMNDISSSAEKKADMIVKNAQAEANQIKKSAEDSVVRLTEEATRMSTQVERFKKHYRKLLENELDHFDDLAFEIFGEGYEDSLGGFNFDFDKLGETYREKNSRNNNVPTDKVNTVARKASR